ncbi:MAG TPA: four helix bundle protein [Pyrinomonadaceae bacterium]|nr:four helix bundle protein [Pyrinomonadaceae bacterium]
MEASEMKERTKAFALRIIRLVEALPQTRTANVIGKQLLRCGTSVGANYRASCRAKSQADFVAKMGIVEEEADETIYWVEILVEAGQVKKERVADLLDEANQLVAIVVSSIRTARGNEK